MVAALTNATGVASGIPNTTPKSNARAQYATVVTIAFWEAAVARYQSAPTINPVDAKEAL